MNGKNVQLESHWGVTLQNEYIEQNSDILTIILPGQGYTNDESLMHYSYKTALELGLDILCVDYGFQILHEKFETIINYPCLIITATKGNKINRGCGCLHNFIIHRDTIIIN